MSTLFKRAALASLLLASSTSFAADFEPGIYVGADIGRSSYKQPGVSDGDAAFGLKLGYQATPNFGAEIIARSLSFRIDGPFADSAYYPDSHVGVAAVGKVPLNERFNLYGRLGVGRTKMHSARVANKDQNETEALFGAGIGYAFSPKWQMSLEATRFNKSEITLVTLGVQYNF
ncbi:hypothetical protein CSQ96_23095 [Janthinobacterium sp. BJB412]|nr:hypothetical protein CSQ96_23095 [Janthinobacterium sp. BJB412]